MKRIAQESPVVHIDDAAERAQRQIGRPSTVASFRKLVVEILEQAPELPSLEILRRARESGYRGGKTALYALVASLRAKPARPLVRFEGLAGEFSQHDFGQVEVEFVDGTSQRIHFFASRLKYSRSICVSLVKDEVVESLVRTLAEHLASWGGAPLQCVFDRSKTIASRWGRSGEVTEWNPVFAYATLEMGIGVELCWPYRAQQKGSVENVKELKIQLFPIGSLLSIFDAVAKSISDRAVLGCPVSNLALELSLADPDFQHAMRAAFDRWEKTIADRFREQQATQKPKTIDSAGLATLVVAVFSGAVSLAKAAQSTAPLRTSRHEIVRLLP